MEINIAQYSGFCTGVERAYKIAVDTTKKNKNVYILGYLVHNSFVIKHLESLGAKIISSISEIPDTQDCVLIISAHGVGPKIYEEAERKCIKIVDTTCPWVKKAQKIARKFSLEGYSIIIVGDKAHNEVKGIAQWAGEKSDVYIIETPLQLNYVKSISNNKIVVLAQTTQSEENFEQVVAKVKEKFIDKQIVVYNTICGATLRRQNSAIELAKKSDVMLVIGDKRSANTKRLKELCENTGTPTYQISSDEDLNKEWLIDKKKIGITAGASTPDYVIDKVVKKIQS